MGAELTVRQKILIAASGLGGEADSFSVENLVVKSFSLYPESFSLRGFHGLHPDSNRVLAKLSGSDGLCGLGWLEHTESRMYRITRKGRLLAKQFVTTHSDSELSTGVVSTTASQAPSLATHTPPTDSRTRSPGRSAHANPALENASTSRGAALASPDTEPCALSARDLYALQQVVKADALRKFLRGHALSFTDACAFWGFSSSSRAQVVQQRIDETADLLKRAVESFGAEGPADPRLPSLSTCYGLFNLHRLMLDKFSREVDALRLPMVAGG